MGYLMANEKKNESTASLTDTHRAVCAVVAPAQVAAAEAVIAAWGATHPPRDFTGAWVAWQPGWDGWSEPMPAPLCFFQRLQARLPEANAYAECMQSAAVAGVLAYECLVTPTQIGQPANTVDGIYLDGAYDPSLPFADPFAAVAAWALDTAGVLPPREQLP